MPAPLLRALTRLWRRPMPTPDADLDATDKERLRTHPSLQRERIETRPFTEEEVRRLLFVRWLRQSGHLHRVDPLNDPDIPPD